MRPIPDTEESLVLRTDFSDETAWEALRAAIVTPQGEFRAYVDFVSEPQYADVTVDDLPALLSAHRCRDFVFLVDHMTISHPEHPILVVDLSDQRRHSFRVLPSEMWGVENNLSLSNMDFHEFADAVDDDGIFRGFAEP